MPLLEALEDDDAGTYALRTSTGSLYRLELGEPRTLLRLPADQDRTDAYRDVHVSALRMDGEVVSLIGIERLRVGERGLLWLDIAGDGITRTLRETSEVVSIRELQELGDE